MQALLDKARYGPWAVVAGGSEGTGASFAREIAAAGINLVLVARRLAPLENLADQVRRDFGVEVRTLSSQLDQPGAAKAMADATADLEIGLYISNAGAGNGGSSFLDMPLQAVSDLLTLNITTTVEACHHFGKAMRDRGRGGIVLMSSASGLGGQPQVAAYSAAKGFVLNLAESLWAELRDDGVDVIAIAAPLMDTPVLRKWHGDGEIAGIHLADDVVRNALSCLSEWPSYCYGLTNEVEEAERLTAARRDRVLTLQAFSSAFFNQA